MPPYAAAEPITAVAATDPAREYLPGGAARWGGYGTGYGYGPGSARILPASIDDITRFYGPELYEGMLLDSAIAAAMTKLVSTTLSGRVHVVPTDRRVRGRPDTPETALSEAIADDNRRNLARLEMPIEEVLGDMFRAVAFGNRLAEVVREPELVDGKNALRKIAPKPWWAWRFGVDRLGNVLGYLPPADRDGDDREPEALLDPRHFALLTWDRRGGDPRGHSILRPCYPWWDQKRQGVPEYLKFLKRFAAPKPVGRFLQPAGDLIATRSGSSQESYSYASAFVSILDPITGADTGEQETATQAFKRILHNYTNDGAIVLPEGGILDLMEPTADGSVFERFYDACDRKMYSVILTSARSVMEAEHGSRADSQTADSGVSSVGYMLARWLGRWVRSILFGLNVDNFGLEVARRYTPEVAIGDESSEDRVSLIGAFGSVGWTPHTSQYSAMDAEVNLPERPEDWQRAESETDADMADDEADADEIEPELAA